MTTMEENSTKLLINLVRSFPELYEVNNDRYRDSEVRSNAWKAIAQRLECTADFCQNAWVTMQEEYIKEKRRLDALPSESDSSVYSKWPWYNDMKFLDCDSQKTKNTSTPTSSSCLASQTLEESDGETEANSNNAVRAVTVSNTEERDATDSKNDCDNEGRDVMDLNNADLDEANNDAEEEEGDEISAIEEDSVEPSSIDENIDNIHSESDETDGGRSDIDEDSDSGSELYEAMASFANQMVRTVTRIVKPEKTSEDLFGELVASHLKSIKDPIERINKEQAISNILFLMNE